MGQELRAITNLERSSSNNDGLLNKLILTAFIYEPSPAFIVKWVWTPKSQSNLVDCSQVKDVERCRKAQRRGIGQYEYQVLGFLRLRMNVYPFAVYNIESCNFRIDKETNGIRHVKLPTCFDGADIIHVFVENVFKVFTGHQEDQLLYWVLAVWNGIDWI